MLDEQQMQTALSMQRARLEGASKHAVARSHGTTMAEAARLTRERTAQVDRSPAVLAALVERGLDTRQVAWELGIGAESARTALVAAGLDGRARANRRAVTDAYTPPEPPRRGVRHWSDADILAALRQAREVLGTGALTTTAYAATGLGPSTQLVINRFGSWTAACDAAGVPRLPSSGSRTTTTLADIDADLLAFDQWCRAQGVRPTRSRMERWLPAHRGRSLASVRQRLAVVQATPSERLADLVRQRDALDTRPGA